MSSALLSPFVRAAALVLCALAILGAVKQLRGSDPSRHRGLVVRAATYASRVDRTSTTNGPAGGVFLRTNRGVEVRVDRALLVQQSASLVDCLGVGGDVWGAGDGALGELFAVERLAHAGHGQGLDPSAVAKPKVIDLLADGDTELGNIAFPELRYCRVHFVFLGASSPAGAPADIDLARVSLYAKGGWRRGGAAGDAFSPFEWRTTAADALLLDLPALIDGAMAGDHAEIVVERRLATYFDDIDFEPTRAREDATQLLRNVNHAARVRVHTR
jgi:hypothetical protein